MTQKFTIGNFNVRNLTPGSTSKRYNYFYSSSKHNQYWAEGDKTENRYEKKIRWLARQVDRMDADIICFQEIFDREPLQEVINASRLAGKVDLYFSGEPRFRESSYKGTPSRIYSAPMIAIMVPKDFKMLEFSSLEDFPKEFNFSDPVKEHSGKTWKIGLTESGETRTRFTRPILRARLGLPKRFQYAEMDGGNAAEITVFTAHFKSKRPIRQDSEGNDPLEAMTNYLREGAIGRARSLLLRGLEAAALRTYVLNELSTDPHRPVIVIGDLNDGPRSESTEIAGGLTLPVISPDAERNFKKREQMYEHAADLCLYSAYHLQTQRTHRDVYYTHIFDGFHDVLDHVLVSSHFVAHFARDGRGRRSIGKVGTLRVFNDHLINADIDDITSKSVGKYLHTRSDHGQVTLRLDWYEKKRTHT
ncbi:MAG TPA: hypothetical protein DD827_05150 [Gammaproteobacteria bacterium]|nr:hypothetical protein [Gammaproteobacteria bacterium]